MIISFLTALALFAIPFWAFILLNRQAAKAHKDGLELLTILALFLFGIGFLVVLIGGGMGGAFGYKTVVAEDIRNQCSVSLSSDKKFGVVIYKNHPYLFPQTNSAVAFDTWTNITTYKSISIFHVVGTPVLYVNNVAALTDENGRQ